jgi:hypothetical protein
MGVPRDRTESGIWAQADPLVTGRTENAVSVKLGYVWVGTKILDTLLLGTFGPSALGRWPGDVRVGDSLELGGGTGGPCLRFGRLRRRSGGGSGRTGEEGTGMSGAYGKSGQADHPSL